MIHFKFSPKILQRLGEELVPNPDQGIIELVKNSYDADATECKIELGYISEIGGLIIISDNGIGMDKDTINEGWLVLGRSKKANRQVTPLGRLPAGNKGLGRLAALQMGSQVTLTTRPQNQPGIEYCLTINWDDFQEADVVEDVPFDIEQRSTDKHHGTEIRVSNLKTIFTKEDIQRLAKELLLLADPFASKSGFNIQLIAPEFSKIEQQVNNTYFNEAEYHLKAKINELGIAQTTLLDWQGNIIFHAEHGEISQQPYKTPPTEFELWVFLLNPQSFSARNASVSTQKVRDWLTQTGNVCLYHRGLRVKPYGDKDDDWLKLNYARSRNPEVRPSTKTVIGRVIVNDPDDMLLQKTDRLGFIENEAFLELKRFAIDVLEWMAKERLKVSETKREIIKKQVPRDITEAKARIEEVIKAEVPQASQPKVRGAIQQYETVTERETKLLREDLQLYRSLATAGTTAAVFAHESGKPIDLIQKIARRIEKQGQEILGEKYDQYLGKPVAMLYDVSKSLLRFSKFPIHLLKREKRRTGIVDVHHVIEDTLTLFQSFFDDAKIEVIQEKADGKPGIYGSSALLEAIITNLLTNAINAFNVEGGRIEGRKIIVRTEIEGNIFKIRVLDNALGIDNIKLDEIWLPGRTTREGGTGLGLTIVRDCVTDLGGIVKAISKGELGGAEFIVELTLIRE
ncbi:ATP-binding protein [Dolichospermum sp. ST_con]|nr:ATP-binding protein [Dolichospermum sp. ST_con]MDD1418626.1 ATP-binding protein [Dolichospermum sp. ST_sed1]MDD1425202.1 ATP-binding protein [Dolichospermum sp. ST_sed9]MDD1429979.1 ATP-binding protein [Dolichospermum sp. ST_sed6]MDD1437166.1 ATP-binding protein [Dolichospermum sp. ST_sed10]MDD1439254.1 ATP-binding protein [Dolichospermum sp. ST_sed3]MDD1445986.1 ATP-binding protein [Dolichospermum sp. ST_sed8]MDD1454636.1 ATP-binding protein [Dolichospermum sp. ST_sed7]MDD1459447.1 ATP-